jgi:glycosyltransferase involved in cell wall biosynthesis
MSVTAPLSIVTVTYNAASTLPATLESIMRQSLPPQELIVIDGGSTDGTVEIIKQYASKLSYWCSEPDQGIYHAMNKGAAHAKASWINFMNAGDRFANTFVLEKVFGQPTLQADADVLYGDYLIDYGYFRKRKSVPAPEALYSGMAFNHQSLFIPTTVAHTYPYQQAYGLAADFAQLLTLYQKGCKFVYTGCEVAIFADGGISAKKKAAYIAQCAQIVQQLAPAHYRPEQFDAQIKQTHRISKLQSLLPAWLFFRLMQLKNILSG